MVGFHISEYRKKQGLTQEKLAEMLEITPQYLSLLETGKREANLKMLVKISIALDISVDRLLFGNQAGDNQAYSEAFSEMIEGCSPFEKNVILRTAEKLKDVLGQYENLK